MAGSSLVFRVVRSLSASGIFSLAPRVVLARPSVERFGGDPRRATGAEPDGLEVPCSMAPRTVGSGGRQGGQSPVRRITAARLCPIWCHGALAPLETVGIPRRRASSPASVVPVSFRVPRGLRPRGGCCPCYGLGFANGPGNDGNDNDRPLSEGDGRKRPIVAVGRWGLAPAGHRRRGSIRALPDIGCG